LMESCEEADWRLLLLSATVSAAAAAAAAANSRSGPEQQGREMSERWWRRRRLTTKTRSCSVLPGPAFDTGNQEEEGGDPTKPFSRGAAALRLQGQASREGTRHGFRLAGPPAKRAEVVKKQRRERRWCAERQAIPAFYCPR